jgi:hypothetical protein
MDIDTRAFLCALYVTGAVLAFPITAYARAIGWRLLRLAFLIWPILLALSPLWLILRFHAALERYFAAGLVEERKRTRPMNVREIREILGEA